MRKRVKTTAAWVVDQFEAAPARTPARPPTESMLALGGRAGVWAGAASN